MVHLRAIAFALVLVVAGPAVSAEERALSGAQIEAWIVGSTVIGDWAGSAYRQYFSDQGWTDYAQAVGRSTVVGRGEWYVTENRYCSVWAPGGATCYRVLRDGDTLIWVTPANERFPAWVMPGNRIDDRGA